VLNAKRESRELHEESIAVFKFQFPCSPSLRCALSRAAASGGVAGAMTQNNSQTILSPQQETAIQKLIPIARTTTNGAVANLPVSPRTHILVNGPTAAATPVSGQWLFGCLRWHHRKAEHWKETDEWRGNSIGIHSPITPQGRIKAMQSSLTFRCNSISDTPYHTS
jgi:hypothetical protein